MDTAILAPTWPSNPLDLRCPADDFDTLLGVLTQLSRKHLLSFRIEVGRAVAAALFAGEPAAFQIAGLLKVRAYWRALALSQSTSP